jgi:AbrB family looped-hinge helix DNA binding protein
MTTRRQAHWICSPRVTSPQLALVLMVAFMFMKTAKVTRGGQISIPSSIRRRWGTSTLKLEDLGDRIVLTPAPDDPIAAARGALAGELSMSSSQLRAEARAAEIKAERRRHVAK